MSKSHAAEYSALAESFRQPEATPLSLDATAPQFRSMGRVIGLSAATLFIGYPFYLSFQWARELNGLLGKDRYSPSLVLIIGIATLGVGAAIYECIFAYELTRYLKDRGREGALPNLTTWVIVLNLAAYALVFTAVLFPLAIPVSLAATCLVQAQFNKLAANAAS